MSATLPEFVDPIQPASVYIGANIDTTVANFNLMQAIVTKFNADVTPEEGYKVGSKRTIEDSRFGCVRTPEGQLFLLGEGSHRLPTGGYEWATYSNGDHEYVNMSLDTNYRVNGRGSIIYVPPGHIAKAKINGKDILLTEGTHVYNNPRFECYFESQQSEQRKNEKDRLLVDKHVEHFEHGTITRVTIEAESLGVAKIDGKLVLLKPGIHMRDTANNQPGNPEYRERLKYLGKIKLIENIVPCHNSKDPNIDLDFKDDTKNIDVTIRLQTSIKIKKTRETTPQLIHAMEVVSNDLEDLSKSYNSVLGLLYQEALRAAFDGTDKAELQKHGDDREHLQKIVDAKLDSTVDTATKKTYRDSLTEKYGIELVELTIDTTKLVDNYKIKQEMAAKNAAQNGSSPVVTPTPATTSVNDATAADLQAKKKALDEYEAALQKLVDRREAIFDKMIAKAAELSKGGIQNVTLDSIKVFYQKDFEAIDQAVDALQKHKLAPILGTSNNFFQSASNPGSAKTSPSASKKTTPTASPSLSPRGTGKGAGGTN